MWAVVANLFTLVVDFVLDWFHRSLKGDD